MGMDLQEIPDVKEVLIRTGTKAITIKELATLMIELSGKNLEIKHTLSKKGEIKFSQADISLSKKEINYFPKSELNEIDKLIKQD